MTESRGLILLDRDGVLGPLVIDPEQGTVDSPLHPDQVSVFPFVPSALARLTAAGYGCCIVSNQPAAAKGKTTRQNLERAHQKFLTLLQASGGKILSSHLCFHREEDGCACRKPRVGLLEQAFAKNPGYDKSKSWMVGDGAMDIEAGKAFGLQTAFLAAHRCDVCQRLLHQHLAPTLWAKDLSDFVKQLLKES